MRGRLYRSAFVALSLLALPLLGCETKEIHIQLPGYENGAIDGIWLWRRTAQNTWERACKIDFVDRRMTEQGEMLLYVQNCVKGRTRRGVTLPTPVERLAATPSTIRINLWYMRYEDPGDYRATAFNAAGESQLSATSLPL